MSGVLFFFRLGTPGLFDADEPAYAQATREMLRSGNWITPHFNGIPRFDKPILFYWLMAIAYRVSGASEFAVRFWSALAGVALVLMLAWAARRWFGPPADLWTGVAFSTSMLTTLLARAAVTDMLLVLFVTGTMLGGIEALAAPEGGGRGWARAAWLSMALAVLVKGPVGMVIPGMAFGATLWLLREIRPGLRRLVPWEGPVLFAAVAVPWYTAVWAANGWSFIQGFIIKHHLTRFTGVISSHAGPLWFYLPVLLVGFFPWCAYLPGALWEVWRLARRRVAGRAADRLVLTCGCWAAGVFVFFSLAGTKLPSYVFPAFPALALLVGACGMSNGKLTTQNRSAEKGVDRLSVVSFEFSIDREASPPGWIASLSPWLLGVTGFSLAAGFVLLPFLFDSLRPLARGVLDGVPPPSGPAWGIAGLLAAGTAAGLAVTGIRRRAVLAAMMVGLLLVAEVAVAPQAYAILQGRLRQFSEEARRALGPRDSLVVYGLNAPSIVFYADHRVVSIGSGSPEGVARVQGLVESGRRVMVIGRAAEARELDRVPGLFRWEVAGGYALYASWPRGEGDSAGPGRRRISRGSGFG